METTTPNFQYNDDEAAKRANSMFMVPTPVGPPGIGPPLPPHQQYPNPAFNQFPPPTPPLPPPQQFQQPPPTAPFFNLTMLNQQPPHQQFHPQRGVFGPAGIQSLTTYPHHQQQQQFQPPNSQPTFPQPFRPIQMMGGALTLPTTMTAVATHQSNNNGYQADLNVNGLRKEFNDALAKKDAIIAQLREEKSILHVEISGNKEKLKKAYQDLDTARARIAELQKKLQEFEAGQHDVKGSVGTEKPSEQPNTEGRTGTDQQPGEGDQKPAAQTDAAKQELTTMDSTTLLQDLLRDHREIGNWADMVGSLPQDDPSATTESFKSKRAQYDIPHQGPFKLFVTNLNLPPNVRKPNPHHKPYDPNRSEFGRMHNDVFQHFGGPQNLLSLFFHFPTTQGICMLEARDFESCIRVLRKNGQHYKGRPVKVAYMVPNTNPAKHAKFTPDQLDDQLEAYKEARARPPPPSAEEKSAVKFNPFGEAKPINMASKYDEMQAKLDKERAEGKSRESIVSNKSGAPRQQMPSLSEDVADQTTGSSNSKATTPGPQPLVLQHNQNQPIPKLMRPQSQDSGGRSSARPPSGPLQFQPQAYGGVFQQSYAPNMPQPHHGRIILPTSQYQQRPHQPQFDGQREQQQHHHQHRPQHQDRRQSQPYNHQQPRPPHYNQTGGPPRDEAAAAGATAPQPRDQRPPKLMEGFDSQPQGGQPMRTAGVGAGPRPRGDNRQPGQQYNKKQPNRRDQQDQQSWPTGGGGGTGQQFPERGSGRNNNYRPGRPQKSRSEGQTSSPPPLQSGKSDNNSNNSTPASAAEQQQQQRNNHINNRPYPPRRQGGERVFTRRGGKGGSSSFKPDNANRQDDAAAAAGGGGDRYKRRSQQPGGGGGQPPQQVQQKDSTASEKSKDSTASEKSKDSTASEKSTASIEQQQPVVVQVQQSEHEQQGGNGNHPDNDGAREPQHQDAEGGAEAAEAKVVDHAGDDGGEQSKKKGKNKKAKKNNRGEANQAVKNNKYYALHEVTDQDQDQ